MRKLILISAIALVSCQPKSSVEIDDSTVMQIDIKTLKAVNQSQQIAIESLQKRLAEIEGSSRTPATTALLDPAGGSGYVYLATNVTPILISFVDSTAVGDGTRVKLRVGNISAAKFSGIDLAIAYNSRMPNSVDEGYAKWESSIRHAAAKAPQDMPGGSWTVVEASLPGIKPGDLGYLAVSANLDAVLLRKDI